MNECGKISAGAKVARALTRPWAWLPLRFHYAMGRMMAWFLERVVRYRRDIIITNISRSFPEKKYTEVKQIASQFYRHLGRIAAEAVWFGGCRGKRGAARLHRSGMVRIANAALLDSLQAERPVVLLCGHNGNWELLGGFFNFRFDSVPWTIRPEDCAVVYRRIKSRFWDSMMALNRCAPLEETAFDAYLETREILRYAIANRSERKVYILPSDQYPFTGTARCSVGEFLHQETKAMIGPASLASRFGTAVVYTRWKTAGDGTSEVTFETIAADASGLPPEDIMKHYYKLLEEDIREEPWNYLWSHKRWK